MSSNSQLDQYENLPNEAEKISSESCSNVGLSVDVVYYKNANKKVKLYKDTSQEERFYNRKCESDKEFNKSYVNYNSAEQYSFPSIECVTIDADSNS